MNNEVVVKKKITEVDTSQFLSEVAYLLVVQQETVNGETKEVLRRILKSAAIPTVDIATQNAPGIVSVGDGLTADGNGTLSADLRFVSYSTAASANVRGKLKFEYAEHNRDGALKICKNIPYQQNSVWIDKYYWEDLYTLPKASASTLGGIKVGDRLSVNVNGVLSADDQSYTLPAATASTLGGVMQGSRVTIDESGVISADDQSYTLPAATASTLGGIKTGAGLTTASDGTTSVKSVYQCTGTADDTAIEGLLDTFFAGSDTSFRLDIIGDFGGDGAVSITTSSTARKTVYLDFSGCNISNESITMTIPTNIDLYISGLTGDNIFLSAVGAGQIFIDHCKLTNIQTTGDDPVISISSGKVFINNCELKRTTCSWDKRKIISNSSYCYISNCLIHGDLDTGSSSFTSLVNTHLTGAYMQNNTGRMIITNSTILSGFKGSGFLIIESSVIDNDTKPLIGYAGSTMAGSLYINNSILRGGGGTHGSDNVFKGSVLKITNSYIYAGLRIKCDIANASVVITSCTIPGTVLDSSYSNSAGGLKLGTDNNTIPKFYIGGNTFNTTGVIVGGNEVTYVTADNGHYMPEFANKFAEVTP